VQPVVRKRHAMRFRGRSFMAYVLTPEAPIFDWLAELDAWLARSPAFFAGRPVILDLASVELSNSAVAHLVASLGERSIRILGLEGIDAALVGPELPPLLAGGRAAMVPQSPPTTTVEAEVSSASAPQDGAEAAEAAASAAPAKQATSLLLEQPIRSGQSVVFTEGDITVLGSVGSGAEVVAGGSIHIYGTLRGRAMAGAFGNPRARIFCHRIEAELLAIDGYYRTAEEIDAKLRSQPTQAWLDGSAMMITPLN
jgi:septum site-determining protein MinC